MKDRRLLPGWLWVGVPVGVVVIQLVMYFVDPEFLDRYIRSEFGLVENLTVLVLLVGCVTAVRLWRQRRKAAARWFGPAMLVLALGCFLFAGEELSWGQHWLGFEPPEPIAQRNMQEEFNLHNDPMLKPLFHIARLFFSFALPIGGILIPWRRHRLGRPLPDLGARRLWDWAMPTFHCMPVSAMTLVVTMPRKIAKMVGETLPDIVIYSASETKEFGVAFFLMLYGLVLWRRMRAGT
jgi:hypothetical protein